ncbi:hypothetical protein CAPTEDRAFT_204756 [Capitella teleta]|uniref:Uncharacterized protein n=1 Tax=Capitella teleta TaxID=283909 RepID=R7V118_CAPTE|nr:hypothetical protein CAPTEDRAFT_204756 [Capitella teleta]|eukprot:ELU12209.1 hypothetical protein CAPTEDRAFT_204756 [Capitella teleta]
MTRFLAIKFNSDCRIFPSISPDRIKRLPSILDHIFDAANWSEVVTLRRYGLTEKTIAGQLGITKGTDNNKHPSSSMAEDQENPSFSDTGERHTDPGWPVTQEACSKAPTHRQTPG